MLKQTAIYREQKGAWVQISALAKDNENQSALDSNASIRANVYRLTSCAHPSPSYLSVS